MSDRIITFLEDLDSSPRPFIADGAMGTMLHERGEGFEHCFDLLNLTQPSLVAEIHHEYIDAGAQIIQTNTFGANRFKLAKHELESQPGGDQHRRSGTCPPRDPGII